MFVKNQFACGLLRAVDSDSQTDVARSPCQLLHFLHKHKHMQLYIPVSIDSFILMAQMGASERGDSAPTS